MKMKVAVIALFVGLFTVSIASARGGMGYYGTGCPYGLTPGYGYSQLDKETQDKISAFYAKNQDLQKQIAMKQAERQALLQGQNADPAKVSKVSGELFDLQTSMHNKIIEAGLENSIGGPGAGRTMIGGRGMGRGMMGGRGMMNGPMM